MVVGLLYKLLWDVFKKVHIEAPLMIVRMCQRWVRTSWVDPSVNHATDTDYLFSFNIWRGRRKICFKTMKCSCACIIHCVINVSCSALRLCSTFWTKQWPNPKLACFPDRLIILDGHPGECNDCRVDFIRQWSNFHFYLSCAIDVYLVKNIHHLCRIKSKLALLNWSSSQQLNKTGTLNLPHKVFWPT